MRTITYTHTYAPAHTCATRVGGAPSEEIKSQRRTEEDRRGRRMTEDDRRGQQRTEENRGEQRRTYIRRLRTEEDRG